MFNDKYNQKPSLNFFGGEPLIMWDKIVKPLTLYIREKYKDEISLGITTNGTLLDNEKIDFFYKNNV